MSLLYCRLYPRKIGCLVTSAAIFHHSLIANDRVAAVFIYSITLVHRRLIQSIDKV